MIGGTKSTLESNNAEKQPTIFPHFSPKGIFCSSSVIFWKIGRIMKLNSIINDAASDVYMSPQGFQYLNKWDLYKLCWNGGNLDREKAEELLYWGQKYK